MGKKQNYSSKVKIKIIRELIKHKSTQADMAVKYNVNIKTIQLWYKQLLNSLEKVFPEKAKERMAINKQQKELYDIDEARAQLKWLKNAVRKLNINTKRAMIDKHDNELSIVTQCKILGLSRSSLYYAQKNKSEDF